MKLPEKVNIPLSLNAIEVAIERLNQLIDYLAEREEAEKTPAQRQMEQVGAERYLGKDITSCSCKTDVSVLLSTTTVPSPPHEPVITEPPKKWWAKGEKKYWFVLSYGSVSWALEGYWKMADDFRYQTGNYFRTREEAEEYKKKLLNI